MNSPEETRPRILVVDDEPSNLQVLRNILQADYRLLFATDGLRALQIAQQQLPDMVLQDIMMPLMDGYTVCRTLRDDPRTAAIPLIFITALSDASDEALGFEAGAVDYITKPVSPSIVRARVRTHLSLVNTNELKKSRLQIVRSLGRAAEFKDNETGMHVIRMSYFSQALALAAGTSPEWAEELLLAAPMHDVGKIGIKDAVLLKPGPFDGDEWSIMRRHPEIGAEILGNHPSGLLKLARSIALTHHEKWDGSGYPHGLVGNAIPLEGRIVAIADVFDALTAIRPYKKAWTVEEAMAHIQAQAGQHFDPHLAAIFVTLLPQLRTIREQWTD